MTDHDISPIVLLTGPTSGIGAGMLRHLGNHPSRPRVILLARNRERLDVAMRTARSAGLTVEGVTVDLSDLQDVSRAAGEVRAAAAGRRLGPIDVAILNAGAQFTHRRGTGAQGWEQTFTINVLAQHLLLAELQPALAPHAHVVLLGSSTHRGKRASFFLVPDPVWQDPALLAKPDPPARGNERAADERERGGVAYASSKLALVTLSHVWAERFRESGRRLNTYDPGLVAGTGLGRDMPAYRYWVWQRLMPAMRVLPGATSPANASRHAVELAMGDRHADLHDGYVEIGLRTSAERITRDADRQNALWEWLETATAPYRTSASR